MSNSSLQLILGKPIYLRNFKNHLPHVLQARGADKVWYINLKVLHA